MNLPALLFEVARRLPEQPAVTDERQHWTYRELARRIAGVAGGLRARGLQPGDRVLLCLENCGEFFELLFGCWAAGLCAVPANARLHPREVEYIAENSGARLLVATPGLANALAPLAGTVDTLDAVISTQTREYEALITKSEPLLPEAGDALGNSNGRAWLFYTSGTTGRPKGAVLTHRNLLFMSQCYYADIDRLEECDTHLLAAPVSHGAGLYSLPFLLQGAHQIVLPHFDVPAILDVIARHERVSFFAAPTMLTRLVHAPEVPGADLAHLKTIYYGGGPMYVADLEKSLHLFGPRLYQLFGQGESPMTITGLNQRLHADSTHPRWRERLGSCGVARTGVLVKVVDDNDRDVPPGEIGEVVTKSDCVMEGYWQNPEANAETLRGGWLHTGDLGSLDEDGFLTLRDRSKDMIISGGSNIYPREIEEVLLRHPDVVEASVVGRPHPEWGEEVVAFVVTKPDATVPEATLDKLCLDHIARFKRPREYRFVESLPKNNYGKVLKTELRDLLNRGRS
ncbi:MAG: long-chain fatty acid--CoA ligase [Alphaproteobacteria bacterium]|nr:long-chain fatty acid--CoA ligase [Alphaproteobacteria bacterium]